MAHKRGAVCQVTAFEVLVTSSESNPESHSWFAIATANVYDPDVKAKSLTPEQAALVGETMRTLTGRASGATEALAMVAALNALLFELKAKGFSSSDV